MKAGLFALLIVAMLGGDYFIYQKYQQDQAIIADLQAQLQAVKDEQTKQLDLARTALDKAHTYIQSLEADKSTAADALNKATAQLQQQLDQLQKDFDAYKQKYRTEARNKAIGEKLDQLVVDGTTYKNVTIRGVDPDGIEIIHEDGGAHIKFCQLSQDWQDRFAYDPVEDQEYLDAQAKTRSDLDAQIHKQLQDQAIASQQALVALQKYQEQAIKQEWTELVSERNNLKNKLSSLMRSYIREGHHSQILQEWNEAQHSDQFSTEPETLAILGEPDSNFDYLRQLRDQISVLVSNLQNMGVDADVGPQ